MKAARPNHRGKAAFTLLEVLISTTILAMVMVMCMGTFLFCLRIMYKDSQRLQTNARLRSLMAQLSKETLDASYFYLFPYYTAIDTSVNLTTDPSSMIQIENAADDDYDKWVAHGDCLVLVTTTSQFRTTDIRQIRIYYRVVSTQAQRNSQAAIRYYETADWGEGSADDPSTTAIEGRNSHPLSGLAAELNTINLAGNANRSGSRQLADKTIGRAVPSPFTPFASGDRYPVFSSQSPDATATNGFIAINMEVVNGTTVNNMLSSSSFNYTVSPRR